MSTPADVNQNLFYRPADLLQDLIRFDTTNPPGNEHECVAYINDLLTAAGFTTKLLAKHPARPNLITRLEGRGDAPPLLLYGHVDVVTTADQEWTYPPFEARIVDDCIWGRGAVDMKGGVVMMLAALLRSRAEGFVPAGDIVLAILSDEEGGGDYGARHLVENHPEQFNGIHYALGELGGFTFYLGSQRFYPIQVAEKQMCWMMAKASGPGGHGSLPLRGGAMAKLGQMLQHMDKRRLPIHITPAARQMIQTLADGLPFPSSMVLRQLVNPRLTDRVLGLLGERGRIFEPLLRNTVNATTVHGGKKVNVIPSEITLELDGRLLPGCSPDDMIGELQAIIGHDIELKVLRHDPGPSEPDMGLFDTLASVLCEADAGSTAAPFIVPGVTDARFFSRLGIQTYGFTPMNLSPEFKFMEMFHGADERIPIKALEFGSQAMYQVLRRYK